MRNVVELRAVIALGMDTMTVVAPRDRQAVRSQPVKGLRISCWKIVNCRVEYHERRCCLGW